ncbi:hypothetical protein CROQUDRAFT_667965 [Cronartium quercuum f. sp. fusiforme G11]|uniref:Proline dehydrogenase n=1 Tax=Cronartium quercuum f. sp. fusiforme G11 TaxID=708437 RepID=A0A9P6NSH6_9BASI|nr:hypothetical protein CROQUDRAFT_667965 [Cronartium quercuum f. sp. fusiforme G11]
MRAKFPSDQAIRSIHSLRTRAPCVLSFPARPRLWAFLSLGCAGLGLASLTVFTPRIALEQHQQTDDALDALQPKVLGARTSHLAHRPTGELIRSYLTLFLSDIPAVVSYGPVLLDHYKAICEAVPVLGPVGWALAETMMRYSFFAHYTGGETPEGCLPVLRALYEQGIGTVLNYSVEAPKKTTGESVGPAAVSRQHIEATQAAVATAAHFGSPPSDQVGSALVRPTTLAIKISGLVTDPYIFERASTALTLAGRSPFATEPELFPTGPGSTFTPEDQRTMENLMGELRGICSAAKQAKVIVMIDAEYSWFQPALDRLATLLAAEFNKPDPEDLKNRNSFPTVYNTFQTLLRSTPERVVEALEAADRAGYSTGIKLVRGAYLEAERKHWGEGEHRLWDSKAGTDACFDSVAALLTSRLAAEAQKPEQTRLGLVVAGHNVDSARKVLKRLRDVHKVAADVLGADGQRKLALDEALRGRLMFAQLYGMADQLTSTLSELLTSPIATGSGGRYPGLQPFVHKYLPFGSVSEVMPYLARRAEENQSILRDSEGRTGGAGMERRLVGAELRRRMRAGLVG